MVNTIDPFTARHHFRVTVCSLGPFRIYPEKIKKCLQFSRSTPRGSEKRAQATQATQRRLATKT